MLVPATAPRRRPGMSEYIVYGFLAFGIVMLIWDSVKGDGE